VFESKLHGRMFGLQREKAAGGWRELHNEDLHNFILFEVYFK
jgi:hypothetical protein